MIIVLTKSNSHKKKNWEGARPPPFDQKGAPLQLPMRVVQPPLCHQTGVARHLHVAKWGVVEPPANGGGSPPPDWLNGGGP
jgi:hypothetical protein